MERLIVTESGSIIDIFRSNSPIWLVRSETMSSIANEMSRKLGPDVLRTLRYAARDDWSMMLSESTITWKGMDPAYWNDFDRLWKADGHLHAAMITDCDDARYVVESTSLSALASGSFSHLLISSFVRPAFKAAVLQEGIIITIVFIYNNGPINSLDFEDCKNTKEVIINFV